MRAAAAISQVLHKAKSEFQLTYTYNYSPTSALPANDSISLPVVGNDFEKMCKIQIPSMKMLSISEILWQCHLATELMPGSLCMYWCYDVLMKQIFWSDYWHFLTNMILVHAYMAVFCLWLSQWDKIGSGDAQTLSHIQHLLTCFSERFFNKSQFFGFSSILWSFSFYISFT